MQDLGKSSIIKDYIESIINTVKKYESDPYKYTLIMTVLSTY